MENWDQRSQMERDGHGMHGRGEDMEIEMENLGEQTPLMQADYHGLQRRGSETENADQRPGMAGEHPGRRVENRGPETERRDQGALQGAQMRREYAQPYPQQFMRVDLRGSDLENRDHHQQLSLPSNRGEIREVRGLVIVTVPDADGKKVQCTAAFTFQDQVHQPAPAPSPGTPPVQVAQVERPFQPPERRHGFRKVGRRAKVIGVIMFLLGVIAFLSFPNPSFERIEEQWEDGEEQFHVHRLYSKRMISMAPGHHKTRDYVPDDDDKLVERDLSRRRLFERVVKGPSENSSSMFPVRGNVYPDGLYYMRLMVGNPPKPFFVDMDTGSDLTWLQCNAPCTSCAKTPHPLYSPRNLVDCDQPACSQFRRGGNGGCVGGEQCDYEIEYGDSSSTMGVLVSDRISLLLTNGSLAQTEGVFGCSYDQQGSLLQSPQKTDGLLGLSRSKIALPSQLADAGLVKNVIAHCLAGGYHGGGYLFLGDELVPSWGMTWAPLLEKPDSANYFVSVSKIQYGGSNLEIDFEPVSNTEFIFDSGTSYTYLVPDVYSAFISAVEEGLEGKGIERDTTDRTLPYCWRGKTPFRSVSEASRYFQPVTLNFGISWYLASRFMIIIPQSYLVITPTGNACMGILDSSEGGGEGINIIGDISLRGHLVVYDNVRNRVGWMPSDCHRPPKGRTEFH